MAELLVRVVDKTHEDTFANQTHTKRGDVIVALEDGWGWGKEELSNPSWIIVKVPGLSLREAEAMTTEEIGDRKVNPMLHARASYLDLGKLPPTGNGRRRDKSSITITVNQFRSARKMKTPARNPFVVGAK